MSMPKIACNAELAPKIVLLLLLVTLVICGALTLVSLSFASACQHDRCIVENLRQQCRQHSALGNCVHLTPCLNHFALLTFSIASDTASVCYHDALCERQTEKADQLGFCQSHTPPFLVSGRGCHSHYHESSTHQHRCSSQKLQAACLQQCKCFIGISRCQGTVPRTVPGS